MKLLVDQFLAEAFGEAIVLLIAGGVRLRRRSVVPFGLSPE
ncbi:hypothetical protein [Parasphingorhabdus pacifica]